MPSATDLRAEFDRAPLDAKETWISTRLAASLQDVAQLRAHRHVLFYASAFLQKPAAPAPLVQITDDDMNGFTSVSYQMDWDRGLTLVLHSPGGVTRATENVVSFLRRKFADLEVIVPVCALGTGTMISLAADRIIMARESRLGAIDPDGQRTVADWLETGMFQNLPDAAPAAAAAAQYFTSGAADGPRTIEPAEARAHRIIVHDLDADTALHAAVLTAYHVAAIAFEQLSVTKLMYSDTGRMWLQREEASAI